jgi:hypothetical protein
MTRRGDKWSLIVFLVIFGVPALVAAFIAPKKFQHHQSHGIAASLPVSRSARPMTALTTELVSHPTPELDGLQVVNLCMDSFLKKTANEALEICFGFSSDRCRAAVGGTLEEFMRYADNPTFGQLVNCDDYDIVSIGSIIPGVSYGLGSRRGEMQTFLVEITEGMTMKMVMKGAEQQARKRPTIEERLRRRELIARGEVEQASENIMAEPVGGGKRKFLWTLQKEVRPPRQDCWLVHEVLFTKNAIHQTY